MHAIRSAILFVTFYVAALVIADDGPIFGDIGNSMDSLIDLCLSIDQDF
jgi:hypothetical protein